MLGPNIRKHLGAGTVEPQSKVPDRPSKLDAPKNRAIAAGRVARDDEPPSRVEYLLRHPIMSRAARVYFMPLPQICHSATTSFAGKPTYTRR